MNGFINIFKKLDKELVRFASIFLALVISYYVFISLKISASLIEVVSSITTFKSVYFLNLLNHNVNYLNNLIFSNDFSIRVGFGCEGTEPIAILLSALFASKSNLTSKLFGASIGTLILLFWNDVRVVTLFIIGKNYNGYFDLFHNDIFPFLSLILSISIYLIWLKQIKKK